MNKYNVRFHENGSLGLTLVASPTGYTVVQKPGKGQAVVRTKLFNLKTGFKRILELTS